MTFTLSEELAKKTGSDLAKAAGSEVGLEIPRDHRVHTQDTTKQSLSVFSEAVESNELRSEGKITQRADLQPLDSTLYLKLKK